MNDEADDVREELFESLNIYIYIYIYIINGR